MKTLCVRMGRKNNLKGYRFDRLLVICDTGLRDKHYHVFYLCKCDCGIFTVSRGDHLKTGRIRSCGCWHSELAEKHAKLNFSTHGDSKTKLYAVWAQMRYRCRNQTNRQYKYYGKRGIRVCPEWKDSYLPFKTWALKNGYQKHLTIDRIDNDGNYEPSNCQFIARSEHSRKTCILRWTKEKS